MKEIKVIHYQCEVCKHVYKDEDDALKCEERRVLQDKGVTVGDKVRILTGDGAGEYAIVKRRIVFNRIWGEGAWKRYWHTVGLEADLVDQIGTRLLTFDAYATMAEEEQA